MVSLFVALRRPRLGTMMPLRRGRPHHQAWEERRHGCGGERVFGEDAIDLPALARTALRPLVAQLMELRLQIKTIEKEPLAWHRTSQAVSHLRDAAKTVLST